MDPLDPDHLMSDPADDVGPTARAFSAYHRAWTHRQATGDAREDVLEAELRGSDVDPALWAQGTLLRETLWTAWAADRGPRRMHATILRHRVRQVLRTPRTLRELMRDPTPEHLRVPEDLHRLSAHVAADEGQEVPFHPGTAFADVLTEIWSDLDVDDDEDEGEDMWAEVVVWLDPVAGMDRARVMVGPREVGEASLPTGQAEALAAIAPRRGRRVVADGYLRVSRTGEEPPRPLGLDEVTLVDLTSRA